MSEQITRLDSKLAVGGMVGLAGAGGTTAGAVLANYVFPPTVEFLPGVQAEVQLSLQKGVQADALITNFRGPETPVSTPFPGFDGIHAKFSEFSPSIKGNNSDTYLSLISKFQDVVVDPTADTLRAHILKGGGVGAASAIAISYLGIRAARAKKHKQAAMENSFKQIVDFSIQSGDDKIKKQAEEFDQQFIKKESDQKQKKLLRLAAIGGTALALAGIGGEAKDIIYPPKVDQSQAVRLSPSITKEIPELKNSTLTGVVGEAVNSIYFGAPQYKKTVDSFWKNGAKNFEFAYKKYERGVGRQYTNNPDIVPVVQVGDLHCNFANYDYYLKPLLKRIESPIVLNTGDTFTNSNTKIYEKNCFEGLADSVRSAAKSNSIKTTIVGVAGNHDPKKPIEFEDKNLRVITLGKKRPSVEVNKINFVGAEDPAVTISYPTLPNNQYVLNQQINQQGAKIAETACKITEDKKTGMGPIILSHRRQTAYNAVAKGCASLALSSHTHKNKPVKKFRGSNNKDVLQHTVGSASGADIGFTIYETPKQTSSLTIQYYDKSLDKIVGFATILLDVSGQVTIKSEDVPNKYQPESAIASMNKFKTKNAG